MLRTPQTASVGDMGAPGRASTDTAPGALTLEGRVTDGIGTAVPTAVVALIGTHDTTVSHSDRSDVVNVMRRPSRRMRMEIWPPGFRELR